MSDLAFLVRGRSVDLVAMTAFNTFRDTLGLGDEIALLGRDDVYVIENVDEGDAPAWIEACTDHQHWFNPNKHRFAAVLAHDGALEAVRTEGTWPHPWLQRLIQTDRPDLVASQRAIDDVLRAWLAVRPADGHYAVPLLAWDLEDGLSPLPGGHWPDGQRVRLRGVLWTLVLRADSVDAASARAEELAVTRARRKGLLVHPHMQGYAPIGPALALEPAAG